MFEEQHMHNERVLNMVWFITLVLRPLLLHKLRTSSTTPIPAYAHNHAGCVINTRGVSSFLFLFDKGNALRQASTEFLSSTGSDYACIHCGITPPDKE
jgi:hypothetical protein